MMSLDIDSDVFLVIDFMNLKIKSVQFFKVAYRNMMCVCVFIRMSVSMYCVS
jgi:hypothetical protein